MERVTFHNPENGFCVLRVKARGQKDLITVVGRVAMIAAGEFIQASGSWVNDRTHGQQFRAAFLKCTATRRMAGKRQADGRSLRGAKMALLALRDKEKYCPLR